jgi:thiol-disulfide isomerase/thioredoxin
MGCPPCKELAPRFIDFASTFPGGRDHVWAVIEGEQEDPAWLAALLGRVANVVVEPVRGPASTAFGIDEFPTVFLLDGDIITAVEYDIDRLGLSLAQ